MEPDCNYFSRERIIFPRKESSKPNPICGHINRLKHPTNILLFVQLRQKGVGIDSAIAQARRCKCRGGQQEDIPQSNSKSGKLTKSIEMVDKTIIQKSHASQSNRASTSTCNSRATSLQSGSATRTIGLSRQCLKEIIEQMPEQRKVIEKIERLSSFFRNGG